MYKLGVIMFELWTFITELSAALWIVVYKRVPVCVPPWSHHFLLPSPSCALYQAAVAEEASEAELEAVHACVANICS